MSAARADEASDAREARQHYQKAQSAFAIGEFDKAAIEYQEAYRLKADPALLFNAAQSNRLAGNNEKALVLYKNYLQFYPKAKNLPEVRDQIAKLQEAIAAAEKVKKAEPQNTMEAQPTPPPQPQVIVVHDTPQQKAEGPTPIYKKWWLWTAVAGGLVVVAVVVALAVTLQPAPWATLPNQGPGAALTAAPAGLTASGARTAKLVEVRW